MSKYQNGKIFYTELIYKYLIKVSCKWNYDTMNWAGLSQIISRREFML